MDPLGRWLWYANLMVIAGLLLRIFFIRLHRVYPILFVYFLAYEILGVSLTRITVHSDLYAYSYMATQAVMHILAIFVVLELYRSALASHPGLAGFGRASFVTVAGVTIFIAAAGTFLDKDLLAGQSVILHRFFTAQRTLDVIILIFLVLIAIFISWFPVDVSRNIAFSIGGFSIFYLTSAATLLAVNLLAPLHLPTIGNASMAASLPCMVAWACLLRPEGVTRDSLSRRSADPVALARLTHQLDSINAALLRLGRHEKRA